VLVSDGVVNQLVELSQRWVIFIQRCGGDCSGLALGEPLFHGGDEDISHRGRSVVLQEVVLELVDCFGSCCGSLFTWALEDMGCVFTEVSTFEAMIVDGVVKFTAVFQGR
jgi:hypothetical protein